jgi:hypothetical protein
MSDKLIQFIPIRPVYLDLYDGCSHPSFVGNASGAHTFIFFVILWYWYFLKCLPY